MMQVARPKKQESEVFENLSLRVAPEIAREVSSLAVTYDRSLSWVARKLLLRGLADFRRDGQFDEEKRSSNSDSSQQHQIA
jgi:hypothetical protein